MIKESLSRLAVEFGRFDEHMKNLADLIRQANQDVEKIQVTGGKITKQFQRIEATGAVGIYAITGHRAGEQCNATPLQVNRTVVGRMRVGA